MRYYDFDLMIGDTVPLSPALPFGNNPTIIEIDSIWVGDHYFKRYFFEDNTISYFFIEGIGHEYGLLEPLFLEIDFISDLYCYKRADSVVYTFENGVENCNFSVSIRKQKTNKIEVSLFPNSQ